MLPFIMLLSHLVCKSKDLLRRNRWLNRCNVRYEVKLRHVLVFTVTDTREWECEMRNLCVYDSKART